MANWFGNKRIRYKKNIAKAQEEAGMYAAKGGAPPGGKGGHYSSSVTGGAGMYMTPDMYQTQNSSGSDLSQVRQVTLVV